MHVMLADEADVEEIPELVAAEVGASLHVCKGINGIDANAADHAHVFRSDPRVSIGDLHLEGVVGT